MTERSAGAVIRRPDGKFLLIQSAQGVWGFPKGHVEAGETPLQAAIREVEEEVGLDVAPDETVHATNTYPYQGRTREVTYFFAAIGAADVRPNGEVRQFRWATEAEVFSQLQFEDLKATFKAVLAKANLDSMQSRDQGPVHNL